MFELDELKRRILEFLGKNSEKPTGEVYLAVKDIENSSDKVRYRLFTLAADGLVERRVVTPKVVMWHLTAKGKEILKTQQHDQ